ncbi:peptidylprolyl isomerase [Algibacter pacificus]|uniref:peptidylprolyl isomerase n=1 Tax=Algibacter pacificus TaxID=2599389 RepID=UPI0011C953A0|nr:peptidylprolyl isomerase [Algibacter pacificus]
MKFKYFFVLIQSFLCFVLNAQELDKEVLMHVDGDPVYVSEFMTVYNKNLNLVQDESQKNVDEYLKLFTNYKLKIKEAKTQGLDKKPAYKNELSSYRKELAKNFMTDNTVTEALVEEAYNRISNEVKAQHILVLLSENASPADTLAAYQKISKLRDATLTEGFENVMNHQADGKTIIAEQLGWFTGFKMVYAFENAAYNTAVGETSQPFRTRFGYHIVNVQDKRKSRGECTVAHIMILKKEEANAEDLETRIEDIYKKIKQGEDFEALAKQFSEDKSSASKGGLLPPFSGGQLSTPTFEDVAFGLKEIGAVSKPFKTQYGWHIIKLYNKKPLEDFKDIKAKLVNKVQHDERSTRIDQALYDNLKTTYNVSDKEPNLDYFASILNADYYISKWKLPLDFDGGKTLFTIGDRAFTYLDFGYFIMKNQRRVSRDTSFKTIISKKYNDFLNASLVAYHEANLENENQDFANIINEYREGLLLFDLMETTIWNTAKTDSLAIEKFYELNKENYVFPERIDAVVASSAKEKTLKKVSKLLAKNKALEVIKNTVNTKDAVEVVFTSGIMDAQHQMLPKSFQFKKGISKIFKHHDAFEVVQVKAVLPETQKTLAESKGAVISDYQKDKEDKWVKALANKYKVVINKVVFDKVKSQIESNK